MIAVSRFFKLTLCGGLVVLAWLTQLPSAFAGERSNMPEYFYQPSLGIIALSIEAHEDMGSPTYSINSLSGTNLSSTTVGDTGYSLTCNYGFTDAWSLDAKAGIDTNTYDNTPANGTDTQTTASGFNDYVVGISNATQMAGWNLHVGIHVGISPGKQLLPSLTANGNNHSGGTSLENYLGFSYLLGGGFAGAKLSYTTLMQRTSNANTSGAQDASTNGGNITALSAFYELEPGGGFEFDVSGTYDFSDPASSIYSDGSTSSVDAHKVLLLGAGAEEQFTSNFNIRVAYQMAFNPTYNVNGYQEGAYSASQLSGRVRFEF